MLKNPSARPANNYYHCPASESVHEVDGPRSKIRPFVRLKMITTVQRPNPSRRWTVYDKKIRPFVRLEIITVD